ncbi:M16 family metallopeptidase [Nocardia terpenica]|nr:pitrilysin family protein [Nocardia terpenica]
MIGALDAVLLPGYPAAAPSEGPSLEREILMSSANRISLTTVVDERLKTTSICLGVAYGSRHNSVDRGGSAHALEHLLMSSPVGDVGPLVQYIEQLGGSANAETGLEHMLFFAQIEAACADRVVELMLRGILEPGWELSVWESERAAILRELSAAAADPVDVVQDAFLAALFPDHPLGRPVGGTPEQVGSLDLTSIRMDHDAAFLASPMALTVIGPAVPDSLGSLSAPPIATRQRKLYPLGPVQPVLPAWPDEFAWVAVGGRSTALGDSGRARFTVLASLLGGQASSLVYRRLRVEEGVAYNFQAWDRGYTESGAWRVLLGADGENTAEAAGIVVQELEKLADGGPSDTDLEAARRQARMTLILDTESPLEYARLISLYSVSRAEPWNLETELSRISRVGPDDIRRAVDEILDSLVTVVRPEKS